MYENEMYRQHWGFTLVVLCGRLCCVLCCAVLCYVALGSVTDSLLLHLGSQFTSQHTHTQQQHSVTCPNEAVQKCTYCSHLSLLALLTVGP
jgi:hypothetical protein